jgi:hypothetical protein
MDTLVTAERLVPEIVTGLLPVGGPEAGDTPEIVGAGT